MPLRDHFRPPIWKRASWEGLHGMWTGTILFQVSNNLPDDYAPEPRVKLGTYFDKDSCAYDRDVEPPHLIDSKLEASEEYAYEVLIYDHTRDKQLVAAIEIVSPGNKDRPESRQAFVTKCAALLQNRVCVSIVDLVTTRNFNLYGELMSLLGVSDPTFTTTSQATYAVICRGRKLRNRPRFEAWAYPLVVGQPLPTMPIWLADDLAVALDLDASYEDACRTLRIR